MPKKVDTILEMIGQRCPNNIFDTQLANAMLGGSFSISYKALVEDLLGVEISKTETRSNWMRRPLSRAQLDYAASDVEFLIELYSIQKKKLLLLQPDQKQ